MHSRIYNPVKHLKEYQKERPVEIMIAWNFFLKTLHISDRGLNTIDFWNIPGF